jgi:hypothetical protein
VIHPRDRTGVTESPGIRIYPLHRNLGRRRTDVLDALRDQHNLPRLPISPKAGGEHSLSRCPASGPSVHGSGLNDHGCGATACAAEAGSSTSSVAVHSAAEAPDAISLAQHSTSQGSRVPSSPHSSRDGGADPKGEV